MPSVGSISTTVMMDNPAFAYTAKNCKNSKCTYKAEILNIHNTNLEKVATYMVLSLGESHLITMQFMQQS